VSDGTPGRAPRKRFSTLGLGAAAVAAVGGVATFETGTALAYHTATMCSNRVTHPGKPSKCTAGTSHLEAYPDYVSADARAGASNGTHHVSGNACVGLISSSGRGYNAHCATTRGASVYTGSRQPFPIVIDGEPPYRLTAAASVDPDLNTTSHALWGYFFWAKPSSR
jgi:hypothetical protein